MSEICIKYGELEISANKARETANEMRNYTDEIQQKVTRPLSQLEGDDSQGYVSRASEFAGRKINYLNKRASQMEAYASRVETLCTHAKEADQKVASQIKDLGDNFLGDRNWIQKVGDFFYDTFMVDMLNATDFGKAVGNLLKTAQTGVSSLAEDAKDWFKYKDGKYWWGIFETVADVVVKIGAVVGAVVASGPLAIVGLVAAIIALAISGFNAVFSLGKKMEALEDYSNGDLGKARYNGGVDKFSDYVDKTDMGDANENQAWATIGDIVDTTEFVAETAQVGVELFNLGAVRDTAGNILKYDSSNANMKGNLLDKLGFQMDSHSKSYHWEFKNLFSSGQNGRGALGEYLGFGKTDGFFYNSASTMSTANQFKNLGAGSKAAKTILDGGSVVSTLMQRAEDVDTLSSSMKKGITVENTWDTVKSSCSMFNFLKLVDDFDMTSPIDKGTTMWKDAYMAN